jgi:predicted flap endonuclease-1-like 5' DNA nuclease
MANHKIEDIEGIGSVKGKKLRAAGVKGTASLLASAATPKQRKALAEKSGLDEAQILKFANMADLYRVKGIGSEYAELLEAAGVDTVPELAKRKAANLAQAMSTANAAKKLVRQLPSEKQVLKWIEQAKSLPRFLKY